MATIVSIEEEPLKAPYVSPSRMWKVKVRNGRRVGTFHIATGLIPLTDYSKAGIFNLLDDHAGDRSIDPERDLDDYNLNLADLKLLQRNGQRIYDELQRIGL